MPHRRVLYRMIAAALLLAGCHRGPRPVNVVLISIDCMNERQFEQAIADGTAPNLAALAGESLVFTRAYAHAPWTTPSHMSMLSGLYPSQHGRDIPVGMTLVGKLGERISSYETLADRLSAAGHETVAFVGKGSISGKYGLGQGFSLYHEASQKNPETSDLVGTWPLLEKWLRQRKPRPFFLFLHTYDLHYPLPKSRGSNGEAIRYIDEFIGRLLNQLREGGQYDSTLLFLTGDHGSSMIHTEGKCCLHGAGHYEENLRVPLVVKLPKGGAHGRKDLLVRHVDILPTALDVVGLRKGSYDGPGVSILSRLGGGADDVASFSEADARCASRLAVVTSRYKYIYTLQDPIHQVLNRTDIFRDPLCKPIDACLLVPMEEFYDLERDPFEEHNLIGEDLAPEAAEALRNLRVKLAMHRNLPPRYRLVTLDTDTKRAQAPEIDEGTKEALRALGYIQ